MLRLREVGRLQRLDDPAGIHDDDPVAEPAHEVEVVADEDQAHALLRDELVEKGEDLQADGDVERRGRLVGDQDLGLGHQHHGDHDALAHAAGDLVRIEVGDAVRIADLHGFQHGERPLAHLAARRSLSDVQAVGLGDLLADGDHRVQRIFRVLHDQADASAADVASSACSLARRRSTSSEGERSAVTRAGRRRQLA